MKEDSDLFDFSDYNLDGYRSQDNTNKKTVYKFKDETQAVPISEFCGLRSKCYSILLDDKLEVKKNKFVTEKQVLKGIKKSCVEKHIHHKNYINCLFSSNLTEQRQKATFNTLRTKDHKIGVYTLTKTSLSCFDDKRYLLDDGIESLSFGHYNISQTSI